VGTTGTSALLAVSTCQAIGRPLVAATAAYTASHSYVVTYAGSTVFMSSTASEPVP
jgi:hypothetical protein